MEIGPEPAGEPRLHIDGAFNAKGSRTGMILSSPEEIVTEQALRFNFKASNNEAEYEALLKGLKLAHELGVQHLKAFSDSQLIGKSTKSLTPEPLP